MIMYTVLNRSLNTLTTLDLYVYIHMGTDL